MKKKILCSVCMATLLYANESEQFNLGEIDISETKNVSNKEEILSEDMQLHNSTDISEALSNTAGVFLSNSGARAEKTISIRGFNSTRVAVFMDGIPIYVPYDGNFDYGRFTTADLSKIDISKGFSSVRYGANTMAGVVNLISKKPTKEFEGNISLGSNFDDDFGVSQYTTSVNLGTKQEKYYLQFAGSIRDRDHFDISSDFNKTENQPKDERIHSSSNDKKFSIKAGWTPDDNSEYAIMYSKIDAEKEQPKITDGSLGREREWDWPQWDKEGVYLFTDNNFGQNYLKTRWFYDKFENYLIQYRRDSDWDTFQWGSRYDDYSYGGSVEFGMPLKNHEIVSSVSYKYDSHKGYDEDDVKNEDYADETISIALEDTYSITDSLALVAGISYDRLEDDKIWDEDGKYSIKSIDSFNPQIGLFYDIDTKQKISFTIARKTHLPTMKERYSEKMGDGLANPDLKEEKATHYELSYTNFLTDNFNFKTNLFLIDYKDAIQSVSVGSLDQNQNIGDFRHEGIELELNAYFDRFSSGLNYTYIDIEDRDDSDYERTGIPEHAIFGFAKYNFTKDFSFYGNVKHERGTKLEYDDNKYKKNNYTTVDTKLIYTYNDLTFEAGVKNLLDEDYYYDLGYPEAGREYFVNMRYTF
ncbi:TonB-dependent receptor plug domain-containing protein [Halarcobacter anaerophilus]|uniref:TonB-dependent receptor n=1 Tax=Halarcobacter anaerophilus TaxID=877500 RepID=A0A4Q0Y0P8_9BACT|nr:TonB-dependent receptor [Halarcobacter anaerophilus]QDF29741.1 TonB-dependent siderophore receptor [Halarcobacter anaerophilus]RXJ62664.1 TonB-dependent receptor [Halarcobacter anaerophilus]